MSFLISFGAVIHSPANSPCHHDLCSQDDPHHLAHITLTLAILVVVLVLLIVRSDDSATILFTHRFTIPLYLFTVH